MQTNKTKLVVVSAFMLMALLTVTISGFAFSFGKYENVKASNGIVTISTSKLNDKARFYKFENSGKMIVFFAVKASDGSMRVAFDACDACYSSKKGYEQQGDKMNCNNCNQKFAINRLGPNASGGCNPGYLPHQQNGANITIKASDLKDGARYF